MKLLYALIFSNIYIVSSYKTQRRIKQQGNLITQAKSNNNLDKIFPAGHNIYQKPQNSPIIDKNVHDYFPQMEYPGDVIDLSKPFYFDSSDTDSFLNSFPTEVRSSYRSIILEKSKRHHHSQLDNINSLLKLSEELKAICKEISNNKEQRALEDLEMQIDNCSSHNLVNTTDINSYADSIDDNAESLLIYCENYVNTINKSIEILQNLEYDGGNFDAIDYIVDATQDETNAIKGNHTDVTNSTNAEIDWFLNNITQTLLTDLYDDVECIEDNSVSDEYLHVLTMLDLLCSMNNFTVCDTYKEYKELRENKNVTDFSYSIPSFENAESKTDAKQDEHAMTSNNFHSNATVGKDRPIVKVPPAEPQFRSKYRHKILQRKNRIDRF